MKRLKLFAAALLLWLSGCVAPAAESGAAESSAISAGEVEYSSAEESGESGEPPLSYSALLECRYFDETSFTLYDSRSEDYPYSGDILCGVVPHHLTAGHMISGFLRAAADSRPDIETVVIIAPQHYESDRLLITSDKGWATPYGAVGCDTEVSKILRSTLGAESDDELLQKDHSASGIIPFVRYYLPEAQVACLLVSPRAGGDTPERIAAALADIAAQRECLFLFSIDFSHYLAPEEADENDAETLTAVLSGDTSAIERMGNDNVDSPYCLSAYVRLSERLGGEISAADNSNTYRLLSYPYDRAHFPEGVTSYFVYITTK